MKREMRSRRLHMGCGEGLIGRTCLSPPRAVKMPGGSATRPASPKTVKDRR